ncbi:MAG: hypothetical protein ACYTFO_09910 [Planctomycetota bacterium]|jgi:hypothetical protein
MRCHSCSKYLGFWVFGKWVTRDKLRFCEPCADAWAEQRRQRVLGEICSGEPPREIFTIPRVRAKDPDRPNSRHWVVGQAAFTDKGICFIQTGQYAGADSSATFAFGIIGGLIAESAARKRRLEEFAEGEHDIVESADDFMGLLCRAEQLLFYPRGDITKLRFDSSGFTVWSRGGRRRFGMEGGGKADRGFRDIADAYRRAIDTNEDPYLACEHLADGAGRPGGS